MTANDDNMPEVEPISMEVTSLDNTLAEWRKANGAALGSVTVDAMNDLYNRLLAREDNVATVLSLAGQQFALYPEIVAEVLAMAGLGTPPDAATRALIHSNYHAAVQKLVQDSEDFHRRHPDEPPFRQDERDA